MNDSQQRIWLSGVASLLEPFGFESQADLLVKQTSGRADVIRLVTHPEVSSKFQVSLCSGTSDQVELGALTKGRSHWWDTDTHSEKVIIADITTAILEHGLGWFSTR
jgi:hypothetical protein